MKKPLFTGACTALVTPFQDDKVHFPMLERLLQRQLDAGIRSFVICGTTGESPTLTNAEKLSLFRRAKEYVGKDALIIAGTGSNSTSHAVSLSKSAQMAGAECLKHFDYIDEAVKLIRWEREYLLEELKELSLKTFLSDANYILFKSKNLDLAKELLEYKIMIRDCSDYVGLDRGFYRIAVKQHNENEGLILALGDIVGK